MFSGSNTISGKHMICDIKEIKNKILLNDLEHIKEHLDHICNHYEFSILGKLEHKFEPQGFTVIYLLSESHISIHTFPERDYLAFDLYTCKSYSNNDDYNEIYTYFVELFQAKRETPTIIDRAFV